MCWTLGLCGRVMVVVVLPFVRWLMSDRGMKPAGVGTRLRSSHGLIDERGGGALSGLVVCHDALVDLAGEEPFEAADDVLFGEALGGEASDVVDGGLVESHSYYGYSVKRRVGLSVPASVKTMPVGLS